jgi:hypothetical protein
MCFVSALASGLETRNQLQNRQEKNEFYFSLAIKIFLTKKSDRRVRGKEKNCRSGRFRRDGWPLLIVTQCGELT